MSNLKSEGSGDWLSKTLNTKHLWEDPKWYKFSEKEEKFGGKVYIGDDYFFQIRDYLNTKFPGWKSTFMQWIRVAGGIAGWSSNLLVDDIFNWKYSVIASFPGRNDNSRLEMKKENLEMEVYFRTSNAKGKPGEPLWKNKLLGTVTLNSNPKKTAEAVAKLCEESCNSVRGHIHAKNLGIID